MTDDDGIYRHIIGLAFNAADEAWQRGEWGFTLPPTPVTGSVRVNVGALAFDVEVRMVK